MRWRKKVCHSKADQSASILESWTHLSISYWLVSIVCRERINQIDSATEFETASHRDPDHCCKCIPFLSKESFFRNFDNFLLNEIHHHYALVNGVQKIIHSKQKRNLPILRRSGISKIITTNAEYKNKFIHQRIIFIDHDNLIPIIELDDPKRAWRWSDLNTQINDLDTFFIHV